MKIFIVDQVAPENNSKNNSQKIPTKQTQYIGRGIKKIGKKNQVYDKNRIALSSVLQYQRVVIKRNFNEKIY